MLNRLSRLAQLHYPNGMPENMSKGRIEDRGCHWKKTETGVEFSIERHQNAWSARPTVNVVQRWSFDLQTKELRLLSETPEQ